VDFGCGIVMSDFSVAAQNRALRQATQSNLNFLSLPLGSMEGLSGWIQGGAKTPSRDTFFFVYLLVGKFS